MTQRPPDPGTLAQLLEDTAHTLRTKGHRDRKLAAQLAARGYPAATISSGPGGTIETNDQGDLEQVTYTSTERAALIPHPYVDIDTRGAQLAADAWRAVETLHRWHQLVATATDRLGHEPPGCALMAAVDSWEPVWRTTDLGGLLPEARPIGRWVYDFATKTGRIPTLDERRRHATGQRVRIEA